MTGWQVVAIEDTDSGTQAHGTPSPIVRRPVASAVLAESGLVELRALPSRARRFVPPDDLHAVETLLKEHKDENVYFGVAGRRNEGDGTLANCGRLQAVWVDIDFHTVSPEVARTSLRESPARPSAVVHSGGGLHLYWFFRPAVEAADPAVRRVLEGLADHFRGDRHAAEPARILRVPGSVNHKYTPSRHVWLQRVDPRRTYSLRDLQDLFEPRDDSVNPATLSTLPRVLEEGSRNAGLWRYARSLRTQGLELEEVRRRVQAANRERARPPLGGAEVEGIIRKAVYVAPRPRPDFRGGSGANSGRPADGPMEGDDRARVCRSDPGTSGLALPEGRGTPTSDRAVRASGCRQESDRDLARRPLGGPYG